MTNQWDDQSQIQIAKIDNLATEGLTGTEDSLAHRIGEVERHLHSYHRVMGAAAIPDGEVHVADEDSMTPFILDADNDDWGAWVQVLGSTDTPVDPGMTHFDLGELFISNVEVANTIYRVQIGFGASGAAALSAKTYTDRMFAAPANAKRESIRVPTKRQTAGTKAWIRCWADGANTGMLDCFPDLHEYEG